jgi:hypothetical protein
MSSGEAEKLTLQLPLFLPLIMTIIVKIKYLNFNVKNERKEYMIYYYYYYSDNVIRLKKFQNAFDLFLMCVPNSSSAANPIKIITPTPTF